MFTRSTAALSCMSAVSTWINPVTLAFPNSHSKNLSIGHRVAFGPGGYIACKPVAMISLLFSPLSSLYQSNFLAQSLVERGFRLTSSTQGDWLPHWPVSRGSNSQRLSLLPVRPWKGKRAEIIHPSTPAGDGIFFVRENDMTLCPCIDYYNVNLITFLKNASPSVHFLSIQPTPTCPHIH